MIKKPRVSIIIPALNVADTIERCVNSALAQTYPNTEVIVVEGDSSDGTRFLLKNIEDRNNLESSKRLNVFYTTFDNIATARNTGLSRATGQYVFWLEPTDYLDMKAVEHYVEIVTRTGADMVKNTCKDSMTGTITFDRVAYIRMILNGSMIQLFPDQCSRKIFTITSVLIEDLSFQKFRTIFQSVKNAETLL